MAKSSKSKILIATLVLLVAVVAVLVPVLINNKRNNTATTVVSCSVNPGLQFVVNQNNKVMNVVATNADGESIALYANFEGMNIEDATELFVQICVESNYIDASNNEVANGKKVTFTFSGTLDDYSALQQSIVSKVNAYFDENGIIAGAVANLEADLTKAIQNINTQAQDLSEKTQQELLDEYVKLSNDIKDVAYAKRADFEQQYSDLYAILADSENISATLFNAYETALDSLRTTLALLPNGEQIVTALEPVFDIASSRTIDELKTNLAEAKTAVNNNSNLISAFKDTLNNLLSDAQTMLDNLQKAYEQAKAEFEADYAQLISDLEQASETIKATVKSEFETRVDEYKSVLEARKDYFAQNQQEIQSKIQEFRNSLSA